MKIAFLDVDGVLNHDGARLVDEACAEQAMRIFRETGCLFVLSSDWREGLLYPDRCRPYEVRVADAVYRGSGIPFTGVTPWIEHDRRGEEIQAWLDATDEEIESFVVIDDLDFDFPERFPGRFVKTSGFRARGLTPEDADHAIAVLNGVKGGPNGQA